MFDQILRARILELLNLFSATGALNHQGQKGGFREQFVKSLLGSLLPHQYGIGSGIVVDYKGNQSPQVDLVIYDRRKMPPILERDGHGVYPIDSVLRVLEVKSTIDKPSIDQFLRQVLIFDPGNPKGLKMAPSIGSVSCSPKYPLCGLFGFSSKLSDPFKYAEETQSDSKTGMIYCDGYGVLNLRNGDRVDLKEKIDNIKYFSSVFLACIEEEARSRSEFSPIHWIRFYS
ncbi:hypothetical protein GIW79_27305 [Pseudomonas sp. PA-7-1E]|uniref:DUF6602 domain-containing protein n=1 Tax=unclassified Pseudomonas TaxID=196821 RepID=UPI001F349C7A|nr:MULTISPECIES: DUF6602 domain-containing protein [unclassified Pseudomonas]MCF5044160.1 hypothetical protein [Pseudomonas sp. PA-7-1E]MCF5132656.1 hypothetical protein [Pseudomonas sp. PA-6-4F]